MSGMMGSGGIGQPGPGAYAPQPGGGGVGPTLPGAPAPASGGGLGSFLGNRLGQFASRMNPNYGQLNPMEQKAAVNRMLMSSIGNMDLTGGQGAKRRPMDFGLGQLDAVVKESYDRSQEAKNRTMAEKEQARREASDKAAEDWRAKQEERYAKEQEMAVKREERLAEQAIKDAEYRTAMIEHQKAAEARAAAAERRQADQFKQEQEKQERMRILQARMRNGVMTQDEQIEYHTLGGSAYAVPAEIRSSSKPGPWDLPPGGAPGFSDPQIFAAGTRKLPPPGAGSQLGPRAPGPPNAMMPTPPAPPTVQVPGMNPSPVNPQAQAQGLGGYPLLPSWQQQRGLGH